jgi:RNA polymerase sigma-54 factor
MSSLSLIQQQRLQLKLTPTQIQVIRMLEIPAFELQQRVNEELQDNPALEEGRDPEELEQERFEEDITAEDEYENPLQTDDFNYDDYVSDDETPDYMLRTNNGSFDTEQEEMSFTGGASFNEYLKSQVYMTNMTKPQRHIAKWVLGNIDEDGYLRRTIEQLVDDLAFQEGLKVTDEEMADIVARIKEFDPPGVAAYDLQECLLTQLKEKPQTESVQLAVKLLTKYYEHFVQRRFDRLQNQYGWTEEDLNAAIEEIVHLNQKPANAFNGNAFENRQTTIIPDFYVENRDGELVISVNNGDIPDLHISAEYEQMYNELSAKPKKDMSKVARQERKAAAQFIKSKIVSAGGFIAALQMRNETLSRTMKAIVTAQKPFFLEGNETELRPMTMFEIADATGYDVSTISRVCNSKYVQTEFGIFPLKYFFSESYTNTEGDEVSTHEIKTLLDELISGESKNMPLTDAELADKLSEHGYAIARRTVAKYREQLGYPVARLRREFA